MFPSFLEFHFKWTKTLARRSGNKALLGGNLNVRLVSLYTRANKGSKLEAVNCWNLLTYIRIRFVANDPTSSNTASGNQAGYQCVSSLQTQFVWTFNGIGLSNGCGSNCFWSSIGLQDMKILLELVVIGVQWLMELYDPISSVGNRCYHLVPKDTKSTNNQCCHRKVTVSMVFLLSLFDLLSSHLTKCSAHFIFLFPITPTQQSFLLSWELPFFNSLQVEIQVEIFIEFLWWPLRHSR